MTSGFPPKGIAGGRVFTYLLAHAFVLFFLIISPGPLGSADSSWVSGQTGTRDWSGPANWASGIVPGAITGSTSPDSATFGSNTGSTLITIDAGREMAQEREDVARGLMTRRDHYGNRGRSWRRETDQLFEEIDYILDRAKAVAAEHGIPVETVMASFGLNSGKGTQPPPEGRTSNVPPSGSDDQRNDAGGAGADA